MRSSPVGEPTLLLPVLLLLSVFTGADVVRVAGFFAFRVELALELVRLVAGKARMPCLRDTALLDLVLLVFDLEDIMVLEIKMNLGQAQVISVDHSCDNYLNLAYFATAD